MTQQLPPWVKDWWRPIATAPKDGDPILLFKPDERRSGEYTIVGYWGEWPDGAAIKSERWIACAGYCLREPTHWMPLPPPPQVNRDGETGTGPSHDGGARFCST